MANNSKEIYFIYNTDLQIQISIETRNCESYLKNKFRELSRINIGSKISLSNKLLIIGLSNNNISLSKTPIKDYLVLNTKLYHAKCNKDKHNKEDVDLHDKLLDNINITYSKIKIQQLLNGDWLIDDYIWFIDIDEKLCNDTTRKRSIYAKIDYQTAMIMTHNFVQKYEKEKNRTTYIDYMNSFEWKILRDRLIIERKHCKLCESNKDLQVHHITYENLKNEKDEDIILLCKNCHEKEHTRISKSKNSITAYYKSMPDLNKYWERVKIRKQMI